MSKDEFVTDVTKEQYADIKFWIITGIVVVGYIILHYTHGIGTFFTDDANWKSMSLFGAPCAVGFIVNKIIDKLWGV